MKKKSQIDMTVSRKIGGLANFKKRRARNFFLQEMREEMRRISWTTKEELITCTKIVVGAIFAFGIGIYVVDLIIRNVLLGINAASRFIIG